MSNSIVLFTGTMTDSVRNTIEEYGPERLEPGDVIVANDPYRTGTHVNDLLFVRPVFHDGASSSAFVNLKAHQLDMGGVVPGGFSVAKRNVYENGLVLSPRALFSAGEPVQRDLEPDLRQRPLRRDPLPGHADDRAPSSTSASGCCSRRVERYGVEAVHGAMRLRLRRRRRADARGARRRSPTAAGRART